ncbi:MAG: hypothetical protein PHO37_04350 [Kiritimatiellae bacterium]|nr:hypothetical protein [Kiritimatiellia bacterium]
MRRKRNFVVNFAANFVGVDDREAQHARYAVDECEAQYIRRYAVDECEAQYIRRYAVDRCEASRNKSCPCIF